MLTQNLALVSTSNQTNAADVAATASAIQKQVTRDLAPIWGIQATVDYFPDMDSIPVGYWPIVICDNINQQGALGYHTDNNNQPISYVQVDQTWQLTCSHEALEMLVDPFGNRMVAGDSIDPQNPSRVNYLVEVCDPCEDASFAYSINGVLVSDFYTPQYFDPVTSNGVRYSFTGSLTQPKQVQLNGYLSWLDPISGQWYQATYFGDSVAINPLNGMQNTRESLRSQIDRLTKNPNKTAPFEEANEKHKAIQEKTVVAAKAIANSRRIELIKKGFLRA